MSAMKTLSRETALLQQEQVERLMQIGAYLRHTREEQSLSLEEVAAQTMIQSRLLRAIEEGKLHHLPEPVYVQGFIRRYAEALSLEGSEFAEAFPAQRSLQMAQSSWKDSPAAQLRPLHLYIAYIALIMASVSLLSYVVGRSASPSNSVRPQISQAIAPTGGISGGISGGVTAVRNQPLASPITPPKQTKPVQIDVKLTAQSWLEVEVDGKVELAEVLQEGAERTWTADKQIRIRAGNAGGVQVASNGDQAVPMGAPGAVEEKSFTPSSRSTPASAAPAVNPASPSPAAQPQ